MGNETEIKLRIEDSRALQRRLKRLGARPAGKGGRVQEENLLFDTPDGRLAKLGQLLRIRTEVAPGPRGKKTSPRVVLTFKRPLAEPSHRESASFHRDYKVREEIELEVTDGAALGRIFAALGMKSWFRYEKFRTTYVLPSSKTWAKGLLIELDETPIGTFAELEGPPAAIDRAATELGFSKQDYILKNYLVLYVEECRRRGEQPGDMVFPPAKSRSR
jgi:adenylate cyclase, class 2